MDPMTDHTWPTDQAEHVWGPWSAKTGTGGPQTATQYRVCDHHRCGASETRETPKA